ncbi:MAG: transposase [Carboxydocellales bacterium]
MPSLPQIPTIAKSFCIILSSRSFLRWSPFGGLLLLKYIWDLLDIPLILGQSGLGKLRGTPAHVLIFTLLAGFWTRQPSVAGTVRLWKTDALMQWMTPVGLSVSESNLSRLLNQPESHWSRFYDTVVDQVRDCPSWNFAPGTIFAVDDSKILHPHAKKNPLLHRSKDDEEWVWGKNIVTTFAILPNGREFCPAFRYWEKGGPTKLELAQQMLIHLAKSTSSKKIWVTFDSWYFAHLLCQTVSDLEWNWVSRAKNSQVFYQPYTGPKRPGRGRQKQWEKMKVSQLLDSVVIPKDAPLGWHQDFGTVFVARKVEGKIQRFPIRLILVLVRREEGSDDTTVIALVSNDMVSSANCLTNVYQKRWRTEVFYRHTKQDLALGKCHSPNKAASIAHTALCLTADLLLRFAAAPSQGLSVPSEVPSGAWMDLIVRQPCHWDRRLLRKTKVVFQSSSDPGINTRIASMVPLTQRLNLWAN